VAGRRRARDLLYADRVSRIQLLDKAVHERVAAALLDELLSLGGRDPHRRFSRGAHPNTHVASATTAAQPIAIAVSTAK
jgi:hypothetical protein